MQDASALYLEAVEVMEDEGQETMALDIFRQAIGQPVPYPMPCSFPVLPLCITLLCFLASLTPDPVP